MACTPVTLVGVGLDCGNVGGLSKVYIADVQDVDAVTITSGSVSAITMEAGKTFKTFSFRKGNAVMNITGTRDDAAGTNFVETSIEVSFNKMETAKRTEMQKIATGNTYAIVKDMNGLYWLVGYSTLDTYANGNVSGTSGTNMGDANRYTLTLTAQTPELPLEVASGIISAIVS